MVVCRIEKLEFLDEGGLLIQLLTHYCISVGYNDKNNIGQLLYVDYSSVDVFHAHQGHNDLQVLWLLCMDSMVPK